MRLEASKLILLREKLLGGDKPLICVPLVSVRETSLINEIDEVIGMEPDIIEWRIDYYESFMDFSKVDNILEIIREKCGDIPVIFTCRSYFEGGYRRIQDEMRLKLIENAIESGYIDVIDAELAFGKDKIEHIKALTVQNEVKLILSYHNFSETPSEEFIIEKLKTQISYGADIGKIAVMPKEQEDVLKLLNATYRARKEIPNPFIAISMGSLGTITRLAGWMFGSDMTFAAGIMASAPGQIPIEEMRTIIDTLLEAKDN